MLPARVVHGRAHSCREVTRLHVAAKRDGFICECQRRDGGPQLPDELRAIGTHFGGHYIVRFPIIRMPAFLTPSLSDHRLLGVLLRLPTF